jgi:hypothetical protein
LLVGYEQSSVSIGDFNGDGKPDVAFATFNSSASLLKVYLGNGNGTFQSGETFSSGHFGSSYDVAVSDMNGDGKPDVLTANGEFNSVSELLGNSSGLFVGETYTIVPSNTITGTNGNDTFTLSHDASAAAIDWTFGTTSGQMLISDSAGLTVNGNGGDDAITLDYSNGNPLPNTLHLNGTFTINGLSGANPFSGMAMEIGQSTVYVNYASGPSPADAIFAALQSGYNAGGWNGAGTGASGAITSTTAVGGPVGVFGIGYADSADGVVAGQPTNTVEIRYTLMGDANLDRVVNGTDAVALGRNYLTAGKTAWDLGNFNYDSTINVADAAFLQKNYNATVSGNATANEVTAAAILAGSVNAAAVQSAGLVTTTSSGAAASSGGETGVGDVSEKGNHRGKKRTESPNRR